MTKEIPLKMIIGAVSNEKGVSEEVILDAVEAALVSATRKKAGAEIGVKVVIDRETGIYETFRTWDVLADEEIENPEAELTVAEAQAKDPAAEIGTIIEEAMESVEFGRIAAQSAKQVIIQKVKEAERINVTKEYESKVGQLITGIVKRTTREFVILDLGGNVDGVLRREDMLPKEPVRPGDRLRAYLVAVSKETRGAQLILSRTCTEMLLELFKIEVPEVGEGIIEIKAAARDPGQRAKIAVKTNDGRMDPVGACVGMRGARVQAVSNELGGERVDIILWDDDAAQFVMNAMSPAEIVAITIDEESNSMQIAVPEEFLSQAIGRNGQNVRLASKLSGWELNVVSEKQAVQDSEAEAKKLQELFSEALNIDPEVAEAMLESGITSIEEVAYMPKKELLTVEGFNENIIEKLRERAKEYLAKHQDDEDTSGDLSLESLAGMNDALLTTLTTKEITTRDDLAECSVEELLEITEINEELAAKLIMAAREHWFSNEATNG